MRNPRQSRCAAFAGHFCKTAEAFGTKPEFGFRDFRGVRRTRRRRVGSCLEGASFKQNLPDA
jgi:hypothetical protein